MSFGGTGFQDGQRTSTLDATSPAWTLNGTFNAQQNSGAIPTAGYEHTLLSIRLTGGDMTLTWGAYLDAGLTEQLFQTTLCLDSSTLGTLCVTVPNLGPYLSLRAATLTTANYTVAPLTALLTNKERPDLSLPSLPLWSESSQGQAPLAQSIRSCPFYWAGPVGLFMNSGATQMEFALQAKDSAGNWNTFWQQNPAASTLLVPSTTVFPMAPVRLLTSNLSGTVTNNNWTFSAVPDQKGI